MPGALGGGYLPPIVATLLGQDGDFLKAIAEAKAALEDLSDTPTEVTITADAAPFESAMAAVEAEAAALDGKTVTVNVRADASGAGAALSALSAAAASSQASGVGDGGFFSGVGMAAAAHAASGGGGGGGFIPGVIPSGAGGRGGGGGFGALAAALLWGGGSRGFFGLGAGLAGMGSIASFAGLGPEHALMTALGLGGSLVGAGLGGGLLAAGGLGTMAVGMGSDAAVMKDATGEVTTYGTQLDRLNRAIAIWGANSTQAKAAQYDLNQTVAAFSPQLLLAVQSTNLAKQSMTDLWDKSTDGAKQTALAIVDQGITLADTFIPLIGQAAQQNLGIIDSGLKPLFAWLEGSDGIGIVNNLESIFARNLPYAIDATDQGVEFVLKTINYLAPATGGIVRALDNLFTKANSPEGFARWERIMGSLIADFHLWEDLIKNAGRDVYDLFSQDAGTASSIVQSLDQMLIRLGDWERSTQGKADIHNLFEVHKQEIGELLQLLPGLLSSLGSVYITVAPALTGALTDVLGAIAPVLKAITSNAWGAWVVGLTIITGKLGILGVILSPLGGVISTLLGWIGKLALGWLGVASAADTATASQAVAAGSGAAESAAGGGLRATGGGLLGLLTGGATDLTPFLSAAGLTAGGAALIAGGIYGVGTALEFLTGDINNVDGPFRALVNPVNQMLSNLNVSSSATTTIKNALTGNSGHMALAISQMTQSLWFSHLSAYQQQNVMQDLAGAMQNHLVNTPQDVATFSQAWKDAESKSALTVPLVNDVYDAFKKDSTQLTTALQHIVANFQSVDHSTATTTVPSAQSIGDILKTTVPITDQIHQIMQYTQQGTSNLNTSTWNAFSGASNVSGSLWNATGPASQISPAASSLQAALWAASGAASSLRAAISGDVGNIANIVQGVQSAANNADSIIGALAAPSSSSIPNHFAAGGIISEPIYGIGLWSHSAYAFGEGGLPEVVAPLTGATTIAPHSSAGGRYSADGGTTINAPVTINATFQGTPETMLAQMKVVAQSAVHDGLHQALSASGV